MSYGQKGHNSLTDLDRVWMKFKMAAVAILNFKYFNSWSRDCNRVQYLLYCTKYH